MSHSLRTGLMGGFLSLLFITMFYISNPKLLVSGYVEMRLLILAAAVIYGLYSMRTSTIQVDSISELSDQKVTSTSTDFVGFSELLSAGFQIFLIGFLLTFFYIYLLFNFIDPSLEETYRDAVVQMNIQYKDSKTPDKIFQEQLQNIKEQDFSPSLMSLFSMANMFKLLLGFIIAFVVALIFRREKPRYEV